MGEAAPDDPAAPSDGAGDGALRLAVAAEGKPRLGPYILLAELGRGGMGAVYRAHRPELKRDYALKVILPGQDASPDAIARFRREAQAAAQLAGHPGIVGVHDIGEADGKTYFAMDLVEGKTLEALITGGNLDHRRTSEIIEGAARALHFAHAHSVLHRDIKPANVLVTVDGQPRVADFGLAKTPDAGAESHRLTKSGAVLGTPAYMSPEQAQGETLDARADVWSLGATLYECLVGEPPFTGDTIYSLLAQILKAEPKPPHRRDPRIPRDLDTIAMKCLEKAPERRYATAEALAADLARWRAGEPITARPVGRFERFAKHVRRHRAPYAVGAIALVAVLGLAGVLGARAWRDRAALALDMEKAEALIEDAPDKALGQLEQLAERAGASHPGLEAARRRATVRAEAKRIEDLRAQAAVPLRKAGAARAEFAALYKELAALPAEGATSPAALGPDAAALPGVGGDPAAGGGPVGEDAGGAGPAGHRARVAEDRERAFVEAWSNYSTVAEILDGARDTAEHREAAGALGDLAWGRLQEAEAEDHAERVARYEAELRRVAPARYAAQLDGAGTLTLTSAPEGAEVLCRRFAPAADGRWEDRPYDPTTRQFTEAPVSLGRTPLGGVALPMGSYLLILRAEGMRDTRYPVRIGRQEHETQRAPIPLCTDAQIGEGFVYVPPGWTLVGGDAEAYNAWAREDRWVEGFCLAEREVTCGEYRAFLEALLGDPRRAAEVPARMPRQAKASGPYWGVAEGRVQAPAPFREDWPVFGISWEDAAAYCEWRSAREDREIRLPTEEEWARAARGADGRRFSWGDRFDWRWCLGGKSPIHGGQNAQPKPVLAAPEDVSVFGVRDLAGGMREWCQDEPADGRGARALRGGAWSLIVSRLFRTSNRSWFHPRSVDSSIGFRVRAAPRIR